MTSTCERDALSAVRRIISCDQYRMRCLSALRTLNLPQGYLAAGFVRNAIWDDIHGYVEPTPLNDIDVIYFNPQNLTKQADKKIEKRLSAELPCANWQVKNQARMHTHHGHRPYKNCEEAISFWIEKETCVAVRLAPFNSDEIDVLAPYGLLSNLAGTISINPRYPRNDIFIQRVQQKGWLSRWPTLTLESALISPS